MQSTSRKLTGSVAALVAVFALGGTLEAAVAASAPTPPAPQGEQGPKHHHPMGHEGHGMGMAMGMMEGPGMLVMHAFHELDLTADQKDKMHALMKEEHEQMMKAAGEAPDLVALGDPANARHAAAVEAAKQRAVAHVQHAADLEQKAWDLLTAEQKAKLPKVLADLQQKAHEHAEGHEGHDGHDGHDGPAAGGPPPR